MKIQMVRNSSGGWGQRILCDRCGQVIGDLLLGMVVWIDPAAWGEAQPRDTATAVVIHKGLCDRAAFDPDIYAPWQELSEVLDRFSAVAKLQQETTNQSWNRRSGRVQRDMRPGKPQ